MEYYLAVKSHELLRNVVTWVGSENNYEKKLETNMYLRPPAYKAVENAVQSISGKLMHGLLNTDVKQGER